MRRYRLPLALALALGLTAAPLAAQFTEYDDESLFKAAVSGYTTEGFESFPPTAPSGYTDGGPFSFVYEGGATADIDRGQIVADDYDEADKRPVSGGRAYGAYPLDHGGDASISFSTLVDAFGAYMRDIELGGNQLRFFRDGIFQFALDLGTNGNGGTYYRGVTADAGFEFNRVDLSQNDGDWITYDDMTISSASANVVPEPSTVVLLGTGLVGLGFVGRRRLRRPRTPTGREV